VWILIQHFHIGMGWCAVEVIIIFFYVFTMIALVSCKPEISFLQQRIFFIPKGYGKTKKLFFIANSADAFFAPAISLAPGHIVSERFPGSSFDAVVFPHSAPLAIRNIRSPFFP